MQSFKLIEIFLFFLCEGMGIVLWMLFSDPIMEFLEIGLGVQISISVLVTGVPAAIFAMQYTKKKIGFWSISIQDSNLHIIFKKKQWDISIKDIDSMNFIEVHYGKDNKRLLHIHFKGKKLKILLPENGFVSDISASDLEMIDDFFSYLQEGKFFANEKMNSYASAPDHITTRICLTK